MLTLKLRYNVIAIPLSKIRNNLGKLFFIKTVACHTHTRVTVDDQSIALIALVCPHKVSDSFSDIGFRLP